MNSDLTLASHSSCLWAWKASFGYRMTLSHMGHYLKHNQPTELARWSSRYRCLPPIPRTHWRRRGFAPKSCLLTSTHMEWHFPPSSKYTDAIETLNKQHKTTGLRVEVRSRSACLEFAEALSLTPSTAKQMNKENRYYMGTVHKAHQ